MTGEYVAGGVLLSAISDGINHPDVALPSQPVQDGSGAAHGAAAPRTAAMLPSKLASLEPHSSQWTT
ncbi:hypothetical protein ACQY0O_002505 [Thecaphora frezii]